MICLHSLYARFVSGTKCNFHFFIACNVAVQEIISSAEYRWRKSWFYSKLLSVFQCQWTKNSHRAFDKDEGREYPNFNATFEIVTLQLLRIFSLAYNILLLPGAILPLCHTLLWFFRNVRIIEVFCLPKSNSFLHFGLGVTF